MKLYCDYLYTKTVATFIKQKLQEMQADKYTYKRRYLYILLVQSKLVDKK